MAVHPIVKIQFFDSDVGDFSFSFEKIPSSSQVFSFLNKIIFASVKIELYKYIYKKVSVKKIRHAKFHPISNGSWL